MPYTPMSCGTGHSFRDTRTMPYAYWGGECQSERAPAVGENAFWSCVLNSSRKKCTVIVMRNERMKEFEGSRRPTKGRSEIMWNQVELWNCATEHERQRWRDEQTKQERLWSNVHKWGPNPVSFLRKNDLSLEFWRGDCHFVREFFSFKPAIDNNNPRLNRNRREADRIHSQAKTNDGNESTTGQLYNKKSRIITTVITSLNYWRVLMNVIGVLKRRSPRTPEIARTCLCTDFGFDLIKS